DYLIGRRNVGFIGNDRHAVAAGIFSRPDHLYDIGVLRHERKPVHEQTNLDDLDGFLARDVFSQENVHLALDEVVGDNAFAGQRLVLAQDIGDIAVWELQTDHVGSAGRVGRSR